MAKVHPLKNLAFILYVEEQMDAKKIAEITGISETTLSKWVTNEDWKSKRDAFMLTPQKLIAYQYQQAGMIMELTQKESRLMSNAEADILIKISTTIKNLDKNISASISMGVLRNFNNYLLNIDLKLAQELAKHQYNFIKTIKTYER